METLEVKLDIIGEMNAWGVSPLEHVLLASLNSLHKSTARQLTRATGYNHGSYTKISTVLKSLFESGYVARTFIPRISPTGGSTYLYQLSSKGLRYLQSLGIVTRPKAATKDLSFYHIQHTLELNQWLILARELEQGVPSLELRRSLHDYDLKRLLVQRNKDDPKHPVVPDAWVEFWNGRQRCISLELDRGHMEQERWRDKIAGYLQWVESLYQETFQSTSLTVGVITNSEARALRLRYWTELEITARKERHNATLFHFAAIDLNEAEAGAVFLEPRYRVPFAAGEVPLL